MTSREWNADSYHKVSAVMDGMAGETLDRLALAGDETVLDAGCGTGRVTLRLLERLPAGRVIAVDADPEMVRVARETLPAEVAVIQADLQELDLGGETVDAVFSTATFHWVPDHDRLFANLARALRPGGRLVAQCGGEGNIHSVLTAAQEIAAEPAWAELLAGAGRETTFPGPDTTARRLEAAGFTDVRCWLQPFPVVPDNPIEYLRTIPLGSWVQRLGDEDAEAFTRSVAARLGDPVTIDYVRLNLEATGG